jgi:hypothetical protein
VSISQIAPLEKPNWILLFLPFSPSTSEIGAFMIRETENRPMIHPHSLLIGLLLIAAGSPLEARTFTSSNGKKLEAEVLSATESVAELKVVNGKTYKVPLSKLSTEDREYIAEWRATRQKAEAMKGVGVAEIMEANGHPGTKIVISAGAPIIEISIGGHTTKFALNPMTPQTLLSASTAEDAGIDVTVPEGGQLPQGVQGIAGPKIQAGGVDVPTPLKMLVVEPQALSERLRQHADGIIGSTFLKDSGAVIDWEAGKIWFTAPAKTAEEEKKADDGNEDAKGDQGDDAKKKKTRHRRNRKKDDE